MAVLFDRSQLGVAIFNALTTTLKVLQIDVRDAAELGQVGGSSRRRYPSLCRTQCLPSRFLSDCTRNSRCTRS